MIYTIYYIINDKEFYSFSSIQVTDDMLDIKDATEYVPRYAEYAGHYCTGSIDSQFARIDLQTYCDQMNEPSYFDTRWSS